MRHGRSGPATRARDQESAHADPVVGGAHRRRFLSTMSPPDAEIHGALDAHHRPAGRGMQQMVNAFSEYARA